MAAKTHAAGHSAKHSGTKKHHGTKKHRQNHHKKPVTSAHAHHVHTVAKGSHHAKPRGYAIDGLAVCAFEAVAMSLRLAGQRVGEDDVLGLWGACGRREVSIGEALAAAARLGLAGCSPLPAKLVVTAAPVGAFTLVPLDLESAGVHGPVAVISGAELDPVSAAASREHALDWQPGLAGVPAGAPLGEYLSGHALILGVDVPGPHAVLATADGWWSWGELHSPWPCRVEEAWAVSWE